MKKAAFYIAAVLLLMGTTLRAQSAPDQTKGKSTEKKSQDARKAGTQSRASGSASITSEATTGTPPTHIDKTNSVPPASNPQNTGVNAVNRKKSGSTVQGSSKKKSNTASQTSSGDQPQKKKENP